MKNMNTRNNWVKSTYVKYDEATQRPSFHCMHSADVGFLVGWLQDNNTMNATVYFYEVALSKKPTEYRVWFNRCHE